MKELKLFIHPESPTVFRDGSGAVIATMSTSGRNAKDAGAIARQIMTATNCYEPLIKALTEIYAEIDRENYPKAMRLASEAYYNAKLRQDKKELNGNVKAALAESNNLNTG